MDYIVKHQNNCYIKHDTKGKFSLTSSISLADRFTYSKAEAFIKNSIKAIDKRFYSVEVLSENCGDISSSSPTMFDTLDYNWYEMCSNIQNFLSELPQYKENLVEMHKEIEAEKVDLEHYIELMDMNASRGYKAYKMLQDNMRKRRKIKDNLLIVGSLLSSNIEDYSKGTVLKVINGLSTRQYEPRILKELFED